MRRAATGQGDAWREAYELELERNGLLRDQLQTRGLTPDAEEPEACPVDFERSYESLAACNHALEAQLSAGGDVAKTLSDLRDVEAEKALLFTVDLQSQETTESVELVRYFGRSAAFYAARLLPPLGLKLTKAEGGGLNGAFVVEDVLAGGSAAASGLVLPGDVLQAITLVTEGSDRSGWTDTVSSFVGGLAGGSLRQTLTDCTFIDTMEELAEGIRANAELGEEVELTLIFERDTAANPVPLEVLSPSDDAGSRRPGMFIKGRAWGGGSE